MNAPRRWLDEGGGATPSERDLLRSAGSMDPPPDAQKQVWAAVLAQLPAAAGTAGATTAAVKGAAKIAAAGKGGASGAAAAAGAGILKSVIIGAGSAVAVLATYSAVAPPDRADLPHVQPAAIVAPASPRPAGPAAHAGHVGPRRAADKPEDPAADPTPAAIPDRHAPADARPAQPQPPAPAAGDPQGAGASNPGGPGALSAGGDPHAVVAGGVAAGPADALPETPLRAEARLVGEVRDTLQRGDAAGALAELGRIDQRFPGGVLGQEREALTIEALAKSGRRAEAAARADAFLQAHPQSMLAGRVQPFASRAPAEPSPR